MSLATVLESFPSELRLPIALLAEALREEFGVRRADFDDLKGIVRELAEAQRRTELRVEELTEAHLSLGQYLTQTIKTGTFCVYVPDPHTSLTWQF